MVTRSLEYNFKPRIFYTFVECVRIAPSLYLALECCRQAGIVKRVEESRPQN